LAASLSALALAVVHVNAFQYGDHNRPVTRAQEGLAPVEAARRALQANAADFRALLVLARERAARSDAAGSSAAYDAALALAPSERVVLYEAAAADLREGRVSRAADRMARLVALYDEARPAVFEVMGRMLAVPAHRALLEERAGGDAQWVAAFIAHACMRLEAEHFAGFFMRRAAAGRAQRDEVRCVTDRLRRAGHWAAAYQAWLNSLPRARLADVGYVFNGGFEHQTSGVGFDWIVAEDPAQAVEFAPARGAAGTRALKVSFTGRRIAAASVWQYLALSPGRYELSGLVRLEGLSSVRGLHWALRCGLEAGSAPIATSERFVGSEPWRAFTAEVTVPSGCPGQVLALEPVGLQQGTTFVSGTALFDELRLARLR